MCRCFHCGLAIALSLTILSTAAAQQRGRRDYNALDKEKFSRVIDRLGDKSEILNFRLFYLDPSRQIAFWLVQLQDGVQLVFIEGTECQSFLAPTFSMLANEHDLRPIVSNDVLAALKLNELIAEVKNTVVDGTASFENRISDRPGFYGAARETLSNLVTLSMNGGKAGIDREHWKSYLGAETAEELMQRAKHDFDATGLPKSWLQAAENDDSDRVFIDLPQIIFEHYLSQTQQNSRYGSGQDKIPDRVRFRGPHSRSFNRESGDNSHFFARLRTHPPVEGMEEGKQSFLAINIHDEIERDTCLRLYEKPDDTFSLLLRNGRSNQLFWLFQDATGGCWMHYVTLGNKAVSHRGDSFQDMFDKNREFISDDVFALFREMGVNVSETMGGPLEIKNDGD